MTFESITRNATSIYIWTNSSDRTAPQPNTPATIEWGGPQNFRVIDSTPPEEYKPPAYNNIEPYKNSATGFDNYTSLGVAYVDQLTTPYIGADGKLYDSVLRFGDGSSIDINADAYFSSRKLYPARVYKNTSSGAGYITSTDYYDRYILYANNTKVNFKSQDANFPCADGDINSSGALFQLIAQPFTGSDGRVYDGEYFYGPANDKIFVALNDLFKSSPAPIVDGTLSQVGSIFFVSTVLNSNGSIKFQYLNPNLVNGSMLNFPDTQTKEIISESGVIDKSVFNPNLFNSIGAFNTQIFKAEKLDQNGLIIPHPMAPVGINNRGMVVQKNTYSTNSGNTIYTAPDGTQTITDSSLLSQQTSNLLYGTLALNTNLFNPDGTLKQNTLSSGTSTNLNRTGSTAAPIFNDNILDGSGYIKVEYLNPQIVQADGNLNLNGVNNTLIYTNNTINTPIFNPNLFSSSGELLTAIINPDLFSPDGSLDLNLTSPVTISPYRRPSQEFIQISLGNALDPALTNPDGTNTSNVLNPDGTINDIIMTDAAGNKTITSSAKILGNPSITDFQSTYFANTLYTGDIKPLIPNQINPDGTVYVAFRMNPDGSITYFTTQDLLNPNSSKFPGLTEEINPPTTSGGKTKVKKLLNPDGSTTELTPDQLRIIENQRALDQFLKDAEKASQQNPPKATKNKRVPRQKSPKLPRKPRQTKQPKDKEPKEKDPNKKEKKEIIYSEVNRSIYKQKVYNAVNNDEWVELNITDYITFSGPEKENLTLKFQKQPTEVNKK